MMRLEGDRLLLLGFNVLLAACTSAGKASEGDSDTDRPDAAPRVESDGGLPPSGGLPAFPGAEGFGAQATGGRGGAVCTVTTLAHDGDGSLQDCLDRSGPKTVVFRVSGVIPGPIQITQRDATVAGQTSPGGVIITGGLLCDNVYEQGSDCRNLILRHLRLRKSDSDTLRLGGASDVIVDHCSLENAEDESIEISRSHRITIQNSIIAEPVGEHYRWGGVLLNYSTNALPLDEITLHHNLWNGVFGRLPEFSCEENGDAPETNCSGHRLRLDLTSNLLFDASDPVWYNRCTSTNEGNDCDPSPQNFLVSLNWVSNVMVRRSSADEAPMFENNITAAPGNEIYYSGNRLVYGQNGTDAMLARASRTERLDFPAVTVTPAAFLINYLVNEAGAWPRDPMDQRLLGYLSGSVDARPVSWNDGQGIDRGDALQLRPAGAAPIDGDGDGMPDEWERAHGLDPVVAEPNATTLSAAGTIANCWPGYTNLECYLNELAAVR